MDALAPPMLLQPLVENAVRYSASRVQIRASLQDGALELEVRNDVATPPSGAGGFGIGLANAQSRLRELYGDSARLTLETSPAEALVRIALPYHRENG